MEGIDSPLRDDAEFIANIATLEQIEAARLGFEADQDLFVLYIESGGANAARHTGATWGMVRNAALLIARKRSRIGKGEAA